MFRDAIKMAILAPFLDLAHFFAPGFDICLEERAQVSWKERGRTVSTGADAIELRKNLRVVVLEGGSGKESLTPAIPAVMSFLLGLPKAPAEQFGMVANGREFVFFKLAREESSYYAQTRTFSIESKNDLCLILSALKYLHRRALS